MGLDTNFYRVSKSDIYNRDKYKEVAYFRKFWSLLKRLDYGNSLCGAYIEVSFKTLVNLRNEAKKTIMMVEKYLTDNGWKIEQSPLNYNSNNIDDYDDITLNNGIFTEDLESECDNICNKVYQENDSFLFRKVSYLYERLTYILETTDFDNEVILHESDW